MENYLDDLMWQILRLSLILLAGLIAFWVAMRFRRWLGRGEGAPPKWAGLSAVGIGLGAFVVLAVFFGFFVDLAAAH